MRNESSSISHRNRSQVAASRCALTSLRYLLTNAEVHQTTGVITVTQRRRDGDAVVAGKYNGIGARRTAGRCRTCECRSTPTRRSRAAWAIRPDAREEPRHQPAAAAKRERGPGLGARSSSGCAPQLSAMRPMRSAAFALPSADLISTTAATAARAGDDAARARSRSARPTADARAECVNTSQLTSCPPRLGLRYGGYEVARAFAPTGNRTQVIALRGLGQAGCKRSRPPVQHPLSSPPTSQAPQLLLWIRCHFSARTDLA